MSAKKPQKPDPVPAGAPFDALLQDLEQLVVRMEGGDLPLEEALREFERGQQLAQACQKRLEEATLKVRTLLQKDGENAGDGDDGADHPL